MSRHLDDCEMLLSIWDAQFTQDDSVVCPFCPASVPKSELTGHYAQCPNAYYCPLCKEAMKADKAEKHARTHVKVITCSHW